MMIEVTDFFASVRFTCEVVAAYVKVVLSLFVP